MTQLISPGRTRKVRRSKIWDLALSENGDLIFGAGRDLLGVDGTRLIEQRMVIRCKIPRGSWMLDDSKTLGSNLRNLLGRDGQDITGQVPIYIREALRPMSPEIEILDVAVEQVERSLLATISYQPGISAEETAAPLLDTRGEGRQEAVVNLNF